MIVLLRRKKLGKTSCNEIAKLMVSKPVVIRNDAPVPDDAKAVIRWGCTSNVPHGAKVYNQAKAIHFVTDKSGSRWAMQEKGLPTPLTAVDLHGVDQVLGDSRLIVRPQYHAQGRKLFVIEPGDDAALGRAIQQCGEGWYASEFVNKDQEIRVFVVQGRVACVAQKAPGKPDQVAWNVAQGGKFTNLRWGDWSVSACAAAVQATTVAGLDFGGVDIMLKDGQPYILEINSAPSLTSPYRQQCMAKAFDWMVSGKPVKPVPAAPLKWQHVIHPALNELA